MGLEVSIYCRENMRGGGAEGVQAPEMRLNQIGRLRHFIILNSGMYPQGRPVRPRSHLHFEIPEPYPIQEGQILPTITEVASKFFLQLRPCERQMEFLLNSGLRK